MILFTPWTYLRYVGEMSARSNCSRDLVEVPEGITPEVPILQERFRTIWVKKKGLGVLEQNQIVICPSCETLFRYGVFA